MNLGGMGNASGSGQRFLNLLGNWRVILLLILTLSALLLRIYSLGTNPPSVFTDELFPYVRTADLARHSGPFFSSTSLNPLNLLTIALFGEPQSIWAFGSTTEAIRISGAIYGTMLVPATYLLVSRILREKEAWWAAGFVAITPFAIQSSRAFYMDQSTVPLFYLMLGVVLFIDSSGNVSDSYLRLFGSYVCFGLVLGNVFSGYGKISCLGLMFILIAFALTRVDRGPWRRALAFGFLPGTILTFFILGLPTLTHSLTGASPGTLNYGDTVLQPQYNLVLGGHFELAVSRYAAYFGPDFLVVHGDPNPAQNTGVTGELLYPDIVFFFGGLIVLYQAFLKGSPWTRFGSIMVATWLAAGPVEVAIYAPTTYTDSSGSIFMIPALQIVSAIGACFAIDRMKSWLEGQGPRGRQSERDFAPSNMHRWRIKHSGPTMIVITAYVVCLGIFLNAYFGPAQLSKENDTSGALGWQWSLFYGFPEASEYIAHHDPTGSSVSISPNGLFGGSPSLFHYYYYQQSTPLNYLNYYSVGRIVADPIVNVSGYYSNVSTWIISGSPLDQEILTSQGGLANTVFTLQRPDGNLAIQVITTRPGLQPWAADELNESTIKATGVMESNQTISSPNTLDTTFSLTTRFVVPYQKFHPNQFFNLAGILNGGVNLAGIRLSSESLQPGGGSTSVLTLNSYLTNSSGTAIQLWSHLPILYNTTYQATIVYSHGFATAYLNQTPYVTSKLQLEQLTPNSIEMASSLSASLQTIGLWPFGLTAAQVGYLCYE